MEPEHLENYKKAGNIAGRARDYGASLLKPGVPLIEVAEKVEAFIRENDGDFAFPCCISVNSDAAHDTPGVGDTRLVKEGDVIKLDCGVQVDGWIGDTAITVEVENERYATLRQAVQEALDAAIRTVVPGVAIRDVSTAIETTLRSFDVQPIVNLTGHSVDQYHQHAGVSIPSVASTATGKLEAGMAVAIEPFGTDGMGKVKDSTGGHIYHFIQPRPQRDPMARAALEHIQKTHADLPFAERWLKDVVPDGRIGYVMRLLERTGAIKQYPVLREGRNGQVAQYEHTVLVLEDGPLATTRI